MPKRVDSLAMKGEIRAAARRVFARKGVRGTGLAHVADAVGMGRSSLYHYYASKESLLRDLVLELLAEERSLFRACLRGPGSAIERVQRLMDANVALLDDWTELGRMTLELRFDDATRFKRFFREIRSELADVIRKGQRSGEVASDADPLMAAATLIGAIDGLLFQSLLDGIAFEPEAMRNELRRLAVKVLEP